MPTWDSDRYLRFESERTRPCKDLVARIALAVPRRIIDLGCGPGNSTAVLAKRWPAASITGLDSSRAMIDAARNNPPDREWIVGDIAQWAANSTAAFDLIFSNAAFQWVSDHRAILPHLFSRLTPGGALAFQVPANMNAPAHRLMRQLAASESWRNRFPTEGVPEWHVHEPAFYYDVLAPLADQVDLWETEYGHVMPSAETIVEWYRGTGLRPFLDALPSDQERTAFSSDYLTLIQNAYPTRADGRVLLPFRRLFVIAYRSAER